MSDYDPLSPLDSGNKKKKTSSRNKKQFNSPTSRLSKKSVRQTTTSKAKQAGQYDRKTITLLPEQIAYIAEIAQAEGVGILALYRWLIDQGLQNYENGATPQPTQQVNHDIQLNHWTSEE